MTVSAQLQKDNYKFWNYRIIAGKGMSSPYRDIIREAFEKYQESEMWGLVRMNVIARDEGKCRACGKKGKIVHHTSYENWGRGNVQEIMDCVLLCSNCHDEEHKIGGVEVPFFAKRNYFSTYFMGECYG